MTPVTYTTRPVERPAGAVELVLDGRRIPSITIQPTYQPALLEWGTSFLDWFRSQSLERLDTNMRKCISTSCAATLFMLLTGCCVSYHAVAKIERNAINRSVDRSSLVAL